RADWTPFPIYPAMAVMSSLLGKADYQGRLALGDLRGYVFNTHFGAGREQVAVVWHETDETDRNIPLDLRDFEGAEVVDVMGRTVLPSNGVVRVGRMPVYVKGVDWSGRVEEYTAGPQ